jgi:hypothetical protein
VRIGRGGGTNEGEESELEVEITEAFLLRSARVGDVGSDDV